MVFATVCEKCGESWFCECGGFNQLAEDKRRMINKLNIMKEQVKPLTFAELTDIFWMSQTK
jgi:hypothetical protein